MNKFKIVTSFFTLLFMSLQINAQTDSTANHDELISATDMEAPGIIAFLSLADSSEKYRWQNNGESKSKMEIGVVKYKESMTMSFDPKSLSMKVEFEQSKKIKYKSDKKQKPIYFHNDIVYSPIDKNDYVKIPHRLMSKMFRGRSMLNAFIDPKGFINIEIKEGPVTYYGMDLNPKTYPILEWAFVYKPKYFEVADFKKEILNCKGDETCIKYTAISGKDKGAYALFDSKNRLIQIRNTNDDYISYTYTKVNVELPKARELLSF